MERLLTGVELGVLVTTRLHGRLNRRTERTESTVIIFKRTAALYYINAAHRPKDEISTRMTHLFTEVLQVMG